ncbi:hypothetical protein [Sphingomonas hankookensis]|uniref:hypothetical protein n=1 Tax=Sphingomonas hankookensis TaxID=563996 RepID=UPI003D302588
MTITFRIDDGHDVHAVPPAEITRDQLSVLCDYLRAQSERLGYPLIAHEWGTTDEPEFAFEARVCPFRSLRSAPSSTTAKPRSPSSTKPNSPRGASACGARRISGW